MQSKCLVSTAAMTLVTFFTGYASAGSFDRRCEDDNLDPGPAIERVEWYAANYPSEIQTKANEVTLRDVTMELAMAWYRKTMLEDPIFGGPAERPKYPTFTDKDIQNPRRYMAPVSRFAPADKPADYFWAGTCTSSCYEPGTQVLFAVENTGGGKGVSFQNVAIDEAHRLNVAKVAVLSEESSLSVPVLQPAEVGFFTESIMDTDHDILVLSTEGAVALKVTPNHPVLDGTGVMREARAFVVGQSLVRVDGSLDPVVRIEKEKFHGRVYNVTPKSASLFGQMVIAEGFINGSAYYQNNGLRHLNRALLRAMVPEAVLE